MLDSYPPPAFPSRSRRHQGPQARENAASAFRCSPHFRGWMADAPTMFLARHKKTGERFQYPVQTKRRRRWHQARILWSGSCSVSSALPRIAFQRVKGERRAFQRGRLRWCITSRRRVLLKLNCFVRGLSTHERARADQKPPRTGKPDFSSRNLTNIATRATHRQCQSVASDGEGEFAAELANCRIFKLTNLGI